MQIIRQTGNARYTIRAHEPGRITVNDTHYTHSLIVTPEHLNPDWEPQTWEALKVDHLEPVAAFKPEIVLLGSGRRPRLPNKKITAYFFSREMGIEVMDTVAACRTYNVLMSEGRYVAAALIIL